MNNFTSDDLLLYIYNEADMALKISINDALQNDWATKEKMDILTSIQNKLNTIKAKPRQNVVDSILKYANKKIEHLV